MNYDIVVSPPVPTWLTFGELTGTGIATFLILGLIEDFRIKVRYLKIRFYNYDNNSLSYKKLK